MTPIQFFSRMVMEVMDTLYTGQVQHDSIVITPTRKEFKGDYTLLVFPLTRFSRITPEATASQIGDLLLKKFPGDVKEYNVIKGFLNVSIASGSFTKYLAQSASNPLPVFESSGEKVLIEYSSPNTNKPLHLGHIRNILLGWSMSNILERIGYEIIRVQVINDRGIAICKSMLAWQKFGEGATPDSTGIKGDHFVGDFYVRFEAAFRQEYEAWQETQDAIDVWKSALAKKGDSVLDKARFFKDYKNQYFNEFSQLGAAAREMLLRWEKGDPETLAIWRMMNAWVYEGFQTTYDRLGVRFDKIYFESDTYLLGKDIINQGLQQGVFYKKDDNSVWIDLSDVGLDEKIVLRSDGTSVYITQDLGTAAERFADFGARRMIYVVADEQNYHFQVLFEIMKRLGAPYAPGMVHLSYGMVELPTGRMKSREGTVVDADDLIDEVIREARLSAHARGEMEGVPQEEQEEIFRKVGLAALKYHIIKVNPKKKMIFDPAESVDMQGHTGPYIQNAFVRIQSILDRTGRQIQQSNEWESLSLNESETDLIKTMEGYADALQLSATQYDPSHTANFAYSLAKAFHKFYHECPVIRADRDVVRNFRVQLCIHTASILEDAMNLLGVEMPRRM